MSDSERYEIKGYTISRKKDARSIAGLSFGFTKEINKEQKNEASVTEKFVTERILPLLSAKTEGYDRQKKLDFLHKRTGLSDPKELYTQTIIELRKMERELNK